MTKQRSPYVIDAVEEFLRTKTAREKKTQASYASVLRGSERGTKKPLGRPFAVYFHNRKMETLTHDDVATWFAQRVHGGAQNSKHRISKAARHFLAWAARCGYPAGDLESAIEPYRQGQGRIDWLSWSDVDRVLTAIPSCGSGSQPPGSYEQGQGEFAMEKLSRLVGTSVAVLRKTNVHLNLTPTDWLNLRSFGIQGASTQQ